MREPDVVALGVLCSRARKREDSTRHRHLGTDRGESVLILRRAVGSWNINLLFALAQPVEF